MITGDHVAIAKETCRLIGIGTFDSHDQGHPSERGRHVVALSVSIFYFFILPNHFLQSMYMDICTSKQLLVRFCQSSYFYVHEDTFLNSKLLLVSCPGFVTRFFASVRFLFQNIKVKSHCVFRIPSKVLSKSKIPCELAQEKRVRSEKPLLTDVAVEEGTSP